MYFPNKESCLFSISFQKPSLFWFSTKLSLTGWIPSLKYFYCLVVLSRTLFRGRELSVESFGFMSTLEEWSTYQITMPLCTLFKNGSSFSLSSPHSSPRSFHCWSPWPLPSFSHLSQQPLFKELVKLDRKAWMTARRLSFSKRINSTGHVGSIQFLLYETSILFSSHLKKFVFVEWNTISKDDIG